MSTHDLPGSTRSNGKGNLDPLRAMMQQVAILAKNALWHDAAKCCWDDCRCVGHCYFLLTSRPITIPALLFLPQCAQAVRVDRRRCNCANACVVRGRILIISSSQQRVTCPTLFPFAVAHSSYEYLFAKPAMRWLLTDYLNPGYRGWLHFRPAEDPRVSVSADLHGGSTEQLGRDTTGARTGLRSSAADTQMRRVD